MPTPNKIAFVSPRYAGGSTVGGAEQLLRNLAERLVSAGRNVRFLATCATDHVTWANARPAGVIRENGLEVEFFPVDEGRDVRLFLRLQERISRRGYVTEADERAWIANSVNSRALVSHILAGGYDCVVAGPYLFGLVHAALRAVPKAAVLLPCLHDEGFAATRIVTDLFRKARAILFNSEAERELACRLYGLPNNTGAVVGMGIDPFEPEPASITAIGLPTPYALYSGRREDGKGTPLLMDYLALFRERTGRDVHFVLTGSGEIRPPDTLLPYVRDLGFVSESIKRQVMAGALVFCQPSVNESFSIVLLEAWMAATPALVHAACGVTRRHCADSGGGLWFRVYPEFEEALLLLLDKPELRAAMGAAGRAYVRREYAWENIDRRLFAALAGIAEPSA